MKILFEKYYLFDKKLGKVDSTNYLPRTICALIIVCYIHIIFIE